MSWEFHAGQRVVCINDNFGYVARGRYLIPTRVPMLNEVLTIRAMEWIEDRDALFLHFEEIPTKQIDGPLSGWFSYKSVCFRPLRERPTDISIFTAMLNPQKQREPILTASNQPSTDFDMVGSAP